MKKILSYKIRIYSNNKAIREGIMSCYICDPNMFSYVASVIFDMANGKITRNDAVNIGRVLYRENCMSFIYRYPSAKDEVNPDFPIVNENDIVSVDLYSDEIMDAIKCLEYQSCEHPDWEKSFSKKVLDSIRKAIIGLPKSGYATWGVPETFVSYNENSIDI
jgi:hypothetical protein